MYITFLYYYPLDYENLGCWQDKHDRAMHVLTWRLDPPDVIHKCKQLAKEKGKKVFGLQNLECFWGEDDDSYQKHGRSFNCNDEGTGGGWALQVYRIQGR